MNSLNKLNSNTLRQLFRLSAPNGTQYSVHAPQTRFFSEKKRHVITKEQMKNEMLEHDYMDLEILYHGQKP